MELPAHHLLSPSTAKRWTNCYGCISMYEKAPVPTVNRYATEGTLAHHIAAGLLKQKLYKQDYHYDSSVGAEFWVSADDQGYVVNENPDEGFKHTHVPLLSENGEPREWHRFKVTQEMLDAVQSYVDYCLSISDGQPRHNIYIEKRLSIPSRIGVIDPRLALGGTVDFGLFLPFDRIVVLDYKHGAGVPVSPFENEQAMSYALALYLSLDKFDQDNISVIEIGIYQPRGLGNGLSIWECTPDDLLIWYGQKLYAQKQIHEGNTTLIAGSWCKWCPAGGICSVREESVNENLGLSVSVSDFSENVSAGIEDKSSDRLNRIVDAEKPLKNLIDSARSLLELRTRNGEPTGWEMATTTKNVRRQWKDGEPPIKDLAKVKIEAKKEVFKTLTEIESEIKTKKVKFDLSKYVEQPTKEVFRKIVDAKSLVVDADFDIIE